ncbi:synaptotagmin-15-like isoform X4 [Dreissena polymorpha]|nr:synaptotagmin-15-like isoform X4 [Dreissena polymorpha]XP_052263098.1 synaptotagmin-15-like isoform X5 [Dreissena polymorpha]XP_052263099.1 synaptotagmin-15-like isoform X4 [Dreissena polymorpha]
MTLVVGVATVVAIFMILLVCLLVMLIKGKKKDKRLQDMFRLELPTDPSTVKSAPISRNPSPKREKRLSCPSEYGAITNAMSGRRTSTFDSLPGYEAEHVQPPMCDVTGKPHFQYQTYFYGSHPQLAVRDASTASSSQSITPPPVPSLHGRVWFTALHDQAANRLIVTLIKVKELRGRAEEEPSRDPFVRVFLLPEEQTYHTTRIHKKTLNPIFNETFAFNVDTHSLVARSLRFSVYDVDRRRIRHTLGHVVVSLEDIDLKSSAIVCRDLEPGMLAAPSIGEVCLALTYLPNLERMKLVVLQARNTRLSSDPEAGFFIRIHVHYGKKLLKIKQTLVQGVGPEVHFNESFSFCTSNKSIDNFNFVLTLFQTAHASKEPEIEIGHVTLGSFMYARGDGLLHWQEMTSKTRQLITRWHQMNGPSC